MRILILGNSYSAKSFFELFKQNSDNIVFSNMRELDNYIEFVNFSDIKDFCLANEINLVLILDEEMINKGLQEQLSAFNISAFSPSIEAVGITVSKAAAKKFMHKNKILTPRFIIIDKPQLGFDYLKNMQIPQAIKPDNHSFRECTQFAETFTQGQKIISNFFESGNKKVIIEDYIEGKNIGVWVLSDGYSAKIIGTSAKYQNNVAFFEPDFVGEELKENILKQAILPTINALSAQGEEYIGILGFDFILTNEHAIFAIIHNIVLGGIFFDMFLEDVLSKLGLDEAAAPFTAAVFGSSALSLTGVRRVVFYAADEVKVRVAGGAVTVRGEGLTIKEMGGGDVLISGTVTGVEIDRDHG